MNKRVIDLNSLVRPSVRSLKPYSSARDEYTGTTSEMIFLDANENPFDNGVNRYPDPHQRTLKSLLAELKGVPEESIFLGNGSDEVLDLLFRAFCEPGKDNCVTLPPTYGMYNVLAGINNVENRGVLLTSEFQPDLQAISSKWDEQSKLLFICSPNNPTGNTATRGSVEQLLNEFNGLVVIDEAYIDFAGSDSWLDDLKNFSNLVVVQTFSKAYGMAGIRLGACYASPEIIEILNRIKPPYNVNELTQQRALKRLGNKILIENEIHSIKEQKDILSKQLLEVNFIEKIFPSEANFLLVKVDNADARYQQLVDCGLVVRNRSNQPLCENTLRITIGTPEENELLIKKLQTI
ncbi:MAG: histidinol-phosphate transaminase [Bacteroidia bacterium]|nr:histidinol-phosphate transaminase [Bacteroidia bacterium]NNF30015.1 histidinol-phosphate transaminase [Flavobacteriaceae bacterium]MBT8274742.1 histidinol-phosphate transaminase [Bacteroidia bacterium]NNJ81494.1 histidinol-phosphate transaminase [Flavobacteriaceae bacterium]NNK53720.1 histidinol-phosphate transaminase [Flavobacteriaceae bacterium]